MDGNSHLNAAGRSRSSQSQSQSPSHSAASAATSSSLHKRKRQPPPSSSDDHGAPLFLPSSAAAFSADTALTSNDDLDSISARGGGGSEDSDDSDVAVDDEEEDFDGSAMRNFTAARLENATSALGRNTKIKLENSPTVKVETPDGSKDGVAASAGVNASAGSGGGVSAPGSTGKEDVKSIVTDSIQTSGAYCGREESLKREEESGRLKFVCVSHDGKDEHMIWLIGLKNIFARQLPNMPKEYIVRLVMDRNHKSVMVIRRNIVVGGITYRPYHSQKFGEIAFCAITADEQVKGYGTRLMNHLKHYARDIDGLTHFLTYADNNAVGYFVKQGFTKEITLDRDRWYGYIKDYDGGILMQCIIHPKLPYIDLSTMIRQQRQAIDEKIKELSNCHTVYAGIDFQKKEAGVPKKGIKVEEIPGLKEAGWSFDQYGFSQKRPVSLSPDFASYLKSISAFMRSLLKCLHDHPDAWPFKDPVDARDVPDYYDIIKDPMDLRTMLKRVESEQYYVTLEMFVADAKRMFLNARTYNSPETIYYKCSTRLEAHFNTKLQSGLQTLAKLPTS